jgi:hypothetical protein
VWRAVRCNGYQSLIFEFPSEKREGSETESTTECEGAWKSPLQNEEQLTIGTCRVQFFEGANVAAVRVTLGHSRRWSCARARLLKLLGWSDPMLDGLLTSILKIE